MRTGANAETVLVVEDDREVRESFRTLLQLDGYKVKTARDGPHALEQLRAGLRPCIILLDLMTPGMGGGHFRAEQLRDPELAHIPVVTFSRHQDPLENAGSRGPAAHLPPSAHINAVMQSIEAHCARQFGSKPSSLPVAPDRRAVAGMRLRTLDE